MPRQTINLDAWKPKIEYWLSSGLNSDQIRANLWREGGIQISVKTFTRRLREWGIYVKQPYMKDYDNLKKRVRQIFEEGQLTDAQAVAQLKREGFEVRAKTYSKMRLEMGLYKRSLPGFVPLSEGAGGGGGTREVGEDR